jgi:outer membrane protein TolC
VILTLSPLASPVGAQETASSTGAALSFEELREQALENSAGIAAREAARRGAQAGVRQAEAQRYPSLSGTLTGAYLANPAEGVSVDRGELSGGLPVQTAPPQGQQPNQVLIPPADLSFIEAGESAQYAGSLSLRQPLFTWGRIENSVELARVQLRVADTQAARERDTVSRTVAGNLYALRQTERLLALFDEQIAAAQELTSIVEQSEEQGAASELELLDQRASLLELRRGRAAVVRQQDRLLSELRSLTGIQDLEAAQVAYGGLAPSPSALPQPEADELARQVLERNRQLALLSERRRAREIEKEIAQAGQPFRPNIAAIAEIEGSTSRVPFLQDDWDAQGNWQARVGIVVEGSLFDGGAARAEAGTKEAAAAETLFQRLDAIQRIQREIGAGVARLRSLGEELGLQQERISLEEERLQIKETQAESGAATRTEVLAQRLRLERARTEREQLELDYLRQYFRALSFLPVDSWPKGVLPE